MEERDVEGVLEVLATEDFWREAKGFPDEFERELMKEAKKIREIGFDKYSNTLVAATQEKAVARLLMDTNYPPYSELANIKVHPNYRGRGIGTKLVREFMDLAKRHGCSILYVIAKKNNVPVHRFYTKLGFKPAMLHGFEKDEKEIVLFQFLEGTSQHEFVHNNPLSGFSASGSLVRFHDQSLYTMRWKDSLTGYHITYYLKGKRHLAMPRIAGISIKENNIYFDAWIKEEVGEIDLEQQEKFRILFANKNLEPLTVNIDYILAEGTRLEGATKSEITLKGMSRTSLELYVKLESVFNVPQLSFQTVIVTCSIKLDRFKNPLLLSAGFEKMK
jgi:ribosomal protein S18 acetylase RimI-like enzyme